MESFYHLILNSADGACVVNSRLKVILWNRQAREILGFSAREALGKGCYEVFKGTDMFGHPFCQGECRVKLLAEKKGQVRNFNIWTHKKSGKEIELNVSIIVIPGRDREPKALVHLFRETQGRYKTNPLARRIANWVPEMVVNSQKGGNSHPRLSAREWEILGLLALGTDTKTIANNLFISWTTARNHIRNILQKLGVHGKLEAVAYAYRHHLIPDRMR